MIRNKKRTVLLRSSQLQAENAKRFNVRAPQALVKAAPVVSTRPFTVQDRPLNEDKWIECERKYIERYTSIASCPVCHDGYESLSRTQILLSCSHAFHMLCMHSYARYVQCRKCPICRAENFSCIATNIGHDLFRNRCATRIQALVRGSQVRSVSQLPNKRLYRAVQKAAQIISEDSKSLDFLFKSLDILMEQRRELMADKLPTTPDVDWKFVEKISKSRGCHECAICIMPIKDELALLSCSHQFHSSCISNFELFSEGNDKSCPYCRQSYQKKLL